MHVNILCRIRLSCEREMKIELVRKILAIRKQADEKRERSRTGKINFVLVLQKWVMTLPALWVS